MGETKYCTELASPRGCLVQSSLYIDL